MDGIDNLNVGIVMNERDEEDEVKGGVKWVQNLVVDFYEGEYGEGESWFEYYKCDQVEVEVGISTFQG